MQTARIRPDELIGLCVAVLLHLAVLAVFLIKPEPGASAPAPERIAVSLAEDVGLEALSPDPVVESRLATAPQLSDEQVPVLPEPLEQAIAQPSEQRQERVRPDRTERHQEIKPQTKTRTSDRPKDKPETKPKTSGASQIGSDFLKGAGTSRDTSETRNQGAKFGAKEQADLRSAINRQLKRHWSAPQGADADRLVTVLRFRLNRDGTLSGRPEVVSQSGINDANRAQAGIHAERAIRSVQLAAPFDLPEEFYDKWKYISQWRFDRRL